MKVKNDHRSKFSNLSNWKEEAWKNQGFNGIRTRDLRDTSAMLYQLSHEATHWEWGQLIIGRYNKAYNDLLFQIIGIGGVRHQMKVLGIGGLDRTHYLLNIALLTSF